ncbi:nucleotidyl transferase AbiEii/AbiGii toxin family protein [Crossiella sp. CA198]|uniref:nucleotidyl transferase AbiEii/AbiGii toxin family protein n=1 Tax=Crossiella sp. CA198 TaxID=3455607 RepID=UPI003F8D07D7
MLTAAEQLGVQPLAVAKDYWACQALRALITAFPAQIIFKGGTSLEKLRLIQRFSEDLDLLVVADFPNERQGRKRLKEMCSVAAKALESEQVGELGGGNLGTLHRKVYLAPPMAESDGIATGLAEPGRILIELGQSGGQHPSEPVPVAALLTRQLGEVGFDVAAYDDLRPFDVPVLHPGRTLLEKLLRVNNFSVNDDARTTEHGWPRIGRQFYDN